MRRIPWIPIEHPFLGSTGGLSRSRSWGRAVWLLWAVVMPAVDRSVAWDAGRNPVRGR